jgi:hypothetical protein
MPGYYVYFISSLPMLRFTANLPFSAQKFLDMCAGLISKQDIEALQQSLNIRTDFSYKGPSEVLRKWCSFNIALNNEIVKIRAARRHLAPDKYLRKDGYGSFDVVHIAIASHRSASLIEGEKILDQARWDYLEGLSFGHYFDLDFLLIYLQKLIILERWQRINSANKQELLESVLTKG